jgi:uncharacterized delta-60 repeat protein
MRAVPLAVISFVLALGAAAGVHAGPADLDPFFGSGGSLVVPFAGNSVAQAVVLQPDGKIVAAGRGGGDMALVRCDATGVLDPSFGVGGVVTADFAGGVDIAYGLVLQSDGMLVAAGSTDQPAIALARYQTDGTPDPTFGVAGRVVTPGLTGHALVLQPDGMLVVGARGTSGFMLVRYDSTGLIDPTFGTAGVAFTDFPDSVSTYSSAPVVLWGLALQPDGKLVAVGGGGTVIALARFEADGTLDATFGTGGHVTTDVDRGGYFPSSHGYAVLVQPDGKLAVAGVIKLVAATGDGFPSNVGIALALRYDADGTLDTAFSSDGQAPLAGGGVFGGVWEARALAIQPDAKLVVVGSANYLRKRINTDGTIDSSFSSSQTHSGAANAVVLQPDEKVVTAGVNSTNGSGTFEIVRFGTDCGDGDVDPPETCDDGNPTNGDGCDNNCTLTACGNHITTAGEACDDGNGVNGDGCRTNCTLELCGDGIVDSPAEPCDDGNGVNGDGCDNNCTPTGCGNDIVTAGEDCEVGVSGPACCTASCTFKSAGTSCAVSGGSVCGVPECDGAGTCEDVLKPSPVCVAAPVKQSRITLSKLDDVAKRSLNWGWKKGPIALADLDDPVATPYALCVYDHSGGTPALAARVDIGDPSCVGCWKTGTKGYDFKENAGAGGSTHVVLHTSNGVGSLKVKATRQFLTPSGVSPLSADPKVTVQLRNAAGACWGADFSTSMKNDAIKFVAKSE